MESPSATLCAEVMNRRFLAGCIACATAGTIVGSLLAPSPPNTHAARRDAKEDQTASLTSSLSEKVGTEPEEFSSFSKDAWESFGSDRDWKRLEDLELEIDYKDSEGKETTRQVRLLKYSVNPDLSEAYLRAHCYYSLS